ncbi:MAG: O-antigen ligase family protein [Chitinophagales bacterium]|nr:O-antigen ligase family protein [Chitinophagales bacterium]
MTRIAFHKKAHYFIAILIAFTLPFGKLTPLFIGLLLINWLVEGNLISKLKSLVNNKLAILFTLLYLVHLIGLFYTNNMESGLFDIQVKLSLLIFPLIFVSNPLSKSELSTVFFAFTIDYYTLPILFDYKSCFLYFIENEMAFFYQEFSALLHTSYMSMYLNFAIVWLIINMFNTVENFPFSKISSSLLIVLFSLIIILLASKSGILTLLLIYIVALFYLIIVQKKVIIGTVSVILIVLGLFFTQRYAPTVTSRLDNFIEAIYSESSTETTESTSVRMLIWKSSNNIIKENFLLGVGTGDAKDALNVEYSKNNITNALKNNLNAHNEFYQIFICLGFFGFVILMLNIFYPIIFYREKNNLLYTYFLIIIAFNFLSESMLETQAGVLFYAFFNSIMGLKTNEKSEY